MLPEEILRRIKQPYRAPDARCFLGPREGPLVADLLAPESLAATGLFDAPRVDRLLAKLRANPVSGFKDNMAFMGILSTQILHRLFVRDFDPVGGEGPSHVRIVEAER